ncbi:NUDIX domain-containing protein [Streptococcus panodentis]|uniref:DNA mismatch repair protein MutT n=1 Tax=Streptococcus panodentis TaxID=1581472 RepID=A0ABS5AZI8_9STRE|nr:NUDIX domain-containing protein [Streptococcus panodentis]MBP2621671.1 DNA mismatch repair protein MutT [Streptococcus panodentis]
MRAGVILYNPQSRQILLIHRWKNNREYFVIPGGRIESGESALEAAQREIQEELNWTLSSKQLQPAFSFDNQGETEQYFYTVLTRNDSPRIHGEEAQRSHAHNIYQPEWVDLQDLARQALQPQALKQQLLNFLEQIDLKN